MLRLLGAALRKPASCAHQSRNAVAATRPLTATTAVAKKSLPPRPKPPPDSEIEESYLKGSGPGGQKINKTNSAVQLKHIPTGIVVKSQATRSRDQNRKNAREILAQKIDDHLRGDQSRSATVGEVKRKKAASAAKKSRRKYKKIEEEKGKKGDKYPEPAAKVEAEVEDAAVLTAREQNEPSQGQVRKPEEHGIARDEQCPRP